MGHFFGNAAKLVRSGSLTGRIIEPWLRTCEAFFSAGPAPKVVNFNERIHLWDQLRTPR